MWKSMKRDDEYKNFEIVMINPGEHESQFFSKDHFVIMFKCSNPWYTLPFDEGIKLCEVLKLERDRNLLNAGYFIILEPDKYECLSYFAFDIFKVFGIDAYPFTMERAVVLTKTKQQEELVLDDLLDLSIPLSRGQPRGSSCYKEEDTTTVSGLLGKHVLLLFATPSCYNSGLFLPALKRMYNQNKGKDDDFEIIYISLDCCDKSSRSDFKKSILGMPWFVYPYDPNYAITLVKLLFDRGFPQFPAIVAFGRDGYLETKESNLACKREWNSEYPFIQADLDEEVRRELVKRHEWDLGRLHELSSYLLC